MKNVKIIALLCALVLASTGFGVVAYRQQTNASADTIESVDEGEVVETSAETEGEVVETEASDTDVSEESIEPSDTESTEEVAETEETTETSETEVTEVTEETSELGTVTISFVDLEGDSIADDIVILDETDLDAGLALYDETLATLEADDYVVVSDEVEAFDGETMFSEDDVTFTITLKKELVFDVVSATVNGIYVPNIIFTDDGHTAVYYLDDGTEIASLSDYDLPMSVEVWRCRGIDKYFEVCCGGRYDLDDDTLEQIHIAGEMIFNGEG